MWKTPFHMTIVLERIQLVQLTMYAYTLLLLTRRLAVSN